jgi:hypothetical protein
MKFLLLVKSAENQIPPKLLVIEKCIICKTTILHLMYIEMKTNHAKYSFIILQHLWQKLKVKLTKFKRTVHFPRVGSSLVPVKIHWENLCFSRSIGNSNYDIQCPALPFHGHLPGTSLKIKLLTREKNNSLCLKFMFSTCGIKHCTYDSNVKTHYSCRRSFITTM